MNLNIVILSGGSGNDALVKGLKAFYKDVNINVIVNAYDNGKSTGVCRSVTNTLGVSDIRKNHIRLYKATNSNPDKRLVEFYEARYNFNKSTILQEIKTKLDIWGLSQLYDYVINFFSNTNAYNYEYKDFNISNIVYSEMYKEIGYEKTNSYFCDLLNIPDFVTLNSFDNVFISANSASGKLIPDEGDIVEYKNAEDKIVSLNYDNKSSGSSLNQKAINLINDADIIIISTGTFWSSIYPTLEYQDFYKYINNSKAKKIWAMNNMEDKDAYGVSSNDFIDIVSNLGLNLLDFTILENLDACDILKQDNSKYKIVRFSMENNNGKHNGDKYAKSILKIYYNLIKDIKYDYILSDFDDTLYSRKADKDITELDLSIKNIKIFNSLENAYIVSGNTFDSIKHKLYRIYGTELEGFNTKVWADSNSTLFSKNEIIQFIDKVSIKDFNKIKEYLKTNYDINVQLNDTQRVVCLKIKPLQKLERQLLADLLNTYIFKHLGIKNCKAFKTGMSTIDILNTTNSKQVVYDAMKLQDKNVLYIGDEIDSGNDKEIAQLCTSYICTNSVEETSIILKLLLEV